MSKTPTTSIVSKALRSMILRMTVVVLFFSGIGYLHLSEQVKNQSLHALQQYIEERVQREEFIFLHALENHEIFRQRFLELYHSFPNEKVAPAFSGLVEKNIDGSYRSRRAKFDGRRNVGIFIGNKTVLTDELKRKLVVTQILLSQLGPAWSNQFEDTYVTLPENALGLYWPNTPNWIYSASGDLDMTKEQYMSVASLENNPTKGSAFTSLFLDGVANTWMSSAVTPILSADGSILANISHDIMVDEIIQRSLNDKLPGTNNLMFRKDGILIADSRHMEAIKNSGGKLSVFQAEGADLEKVYKAALNLDPQTNNKIIEIGDSYYGVVQIRGPNWYFVTELPKSNISMIARDSAVFIVLIGFLSLVIEILIVYSLLKKQVAAPLGKFTFAALEVSSGNFGTTLEHSHDAREISELTSAFNRMSTAVRDRDQQLESHANALEREVEVRSAELDRQRQIAVQVSKMAALGQMAGGIAHEINNPLAALQLNLQRVQEKVAETSPDHSALPLIDRSLLIVGKAARIISNLRTLSRDASSDDFQPASLQTIFSDAMMLCEKRSSLASIKFHQEIPPEPLLINCQHGEISQVLMNLMTNAYDAVKLLPKPWVRLQMQEQDGKCVIRLTDCGPGIPAETAEKIFQPFYTTKPLGEGTGLGLSISYGIILRHGGSIRIDSDSPNTSFVIELPLYREENPLMIRAG